MIVKKKKLKISSGTLFGVGGGAFLVLTGALMVHSSLFNETVPGCQTRYPQAGLFALERSSGDLVDSATLQARLSGNDWAVTENLSIARAGRSGGRAALRVDFAAGGSFNSAKRTASSGVGFEWRPNFLAAASSACLAYAIRLPADFDFGDGGTLPGLFGEGTVPGEAGQQAFSARMRWLAGGKVAVQPITASGQKSRLAIVDENWLTLPRGEWVDIEQEVVLNDPGQANGRIRVWVGGKLHLDAGEVAFRQDDDVRMIGVIGDTHYADRAMEWRPARKPAQIDISPFLVRWR